MQRLRWCWSPMTSRRCWSSSRATCGRSTAEAGSHRSVRRRRGVEARARAPARSRRARRDDARHERLGGLSQDPPGRRRSLTPACSCSPASARASTRPRAPSSGPTSTSTSRSTSRSSTRRSSASSQKRAAQREAVPRPCQRGRLHRARQRGGRAGEGCGDRALQEQAAREEGQAGGSNSRAVGSKRDPRRRRKERRPWLLRKAKKGAKKAKKGAKKAKKK